MGEALGEVPESLRAEEEDHVVALRAEETVPQQRLHAPGRQQTARLLLRFGFGFGSGFGFNGEHIAIADMDSRVTPVESSVHGTTHTDTACVVHAVMLLLYKCLSACTVFMYYMRVLYLYTIGVNYICIVFVSTVCVFVSHTVCVF